MDKQKKGELGEQAVNKLAYDTYLKYWCYPNPKNERGNKKEICDLLILFGSSAIIFSIKNYSFDGNYERYFRSTLDKAVSQIKGAERKLYQRHTDIYIIHPDTGELKFEPEKFPNIHRVVINISTEPLFYPPGRLTSTNEFVHIFNWHAFLNLVQELDTIPDFIQYLNERQTVLKLKDTILMNGLEDDWDINTSQEFIKFMETLNPMVKQIIIVSGNELDILADYYLNNRRFNKHFYSGDSHSINFQLDGSWEEYLKRKEVQRKKSEDRRSYFVDEFVKREVLHRNDKRNIEIAVELLALNRFERRILGKQFFDFVDRYRDESGYFVARRYGILKDMVIAFVLHGSSMAHEHVMLSMNLAIKGYAYWERYKTKKIIAIAVSNELIGFKFGFMKDIEPFSSADEEIIIHDLKILKWFQNIETIKFNIKEYPDM